MADKSVSILVVDDEEAISELLVQLLSPDFDCIAAHDADEALRLIGSRRFDIVLADVAMPGMTGIELCRHIIEKKEGTAVLILSGRSETEVALEAMGAGAFDYITKPFDLLQVRAAVERALKHLDAQSEGQKKTAVRGKEPGG